MNSWNQHNDQITSCSQQVTLSFSFSLLLISSSLVLFDLFVNILVHNLAEPAYEADVAQLEYKLVAGEHSLVIKVKGFNHKLPVSDLRWQDVTVSWFYSDV